MLVKIEVPIEFNLVTKTSEQEKFLESLPPDEIRSMLKKLFKEALQEAGDNIGVFMGTALAATIK